MKDFLNKAGRVAKEAAGKAGEKAGDLIEVGKVKAKILSLNSDKKELYRQIGEYYYERFEEGEVVDGAVGDLCRDIKSLSEQISELEENL